MARGPKKHLKRIGAPSHWMLDKLTGLYAPRPSQGPHKLRECVPLAVLLRNRLKYALTYTEVKYILQQRLVTVDGKVRTDHTFPAGFMDVIEIEKTGEAFRMLLDTKGRFVPHRISDEEATFKLCRVKNILLGKNGVPMAVTHDGRTVRYIHPEVQANDSIKLNLETGKVEEFYKFAVGQTVVINGGHNIGRVGKIVSREAHPGSFEIVHVEDATGARFSTRISNVFVIGNEESVVSLPKLKGIRLSNVADREARLQKLHH